MAKIDFDSEELERMMIGALMLALYDAGVLVRTDDSNEGELWLHTISPGNIPGGWVRLTIGNGIDVVTDHSSNLENVLSPLSELHAKHA